LGKENRLWAQGERRRVAEEEERTCFLWPILFAGFQLKLRIIVYFVKGVTILKFVLVDTKI